MHRFLVAEKEKDSRLKAAIDQTSPPTWVAMMDTNFDIKDGSPEAIETARDLRIASRFYVEELPEMVQIILKTTGDARKAGFPIRATELLGGSIRYAPESHLEQQGPFRFSDYATRYVALFAASRDHLQVIRGMGAGLWDQSPSQSPNQTAQPIRGSSPRPGDRPSTRSRNSSRSGTRPR